MSLPNIQIDGALRYRPAPYSFDGGSAMRGQIIEVTDILARLSGANLTDAASILPVEFDELSTLLKRLRTSALVFDALRREEGL